MVPTPTTATPNFAMMIPRLLCVFYGHGAALLHGLIDRVNDKDVPQSLFAVRFRALAFLDAGRKGVQFEGKFVDGLEGLRKPLSTNLAAEPAFFLKCKCRTQFHPALLAVHVYKVREGGTVSRRPLQDEAAGKVETERDPLLHILV